MCEGCTLLRSVATKLLSVLPDSIDLRELLNPKELEILENISNEEKRSAAIRAETTLVSTLRSELRESQARLSALGEDPEPDKDNDLPTIAEWLDMVELSKRSYDGVLSQLSEGATFFAGRTLDALVAVPEPLWLGGRIPQFGRKSLQEIREIIEGMGMHLGMPRSEARKICREWHRERRELLRK